MMHAYRSLFAAGAALALLAAPAAKAQTAADKGYARVGVGLNVAKPLHLPGDNKPTNTWMGVHYRTNWIEMGYLGGRFNGNGKETEATENGAQYYLGGSFPLGKLGVGKRVVGTKGILLMPVLGGGYSYLKMGDLTASQVYAAPGLSLQLPYVLIDLRAMGVYTLDKEETPAAALKGFTFQPQLTLQFDGLWDVFDPKKSYDGHANGVNTSTSRTLVSSDANYDTYRVTTTSTPYDFDMYVTGGESFLAVTPRVSGGFNNATRGNTVMGGLGLSGRTYAFSADAFVEYGQLGVSSAWSTAPTADNPTPRDGEINSADLRFGGSRTAGRGMVRLGIDLMSLLQHMGVHSDGGGEGATKFFRVTGGYGAGYGIVNGPLTMMNPNQTEALNALFTPQPLSNGQVINGSLPQNEFSDPRLGRNGYASQWYFQVEAGVASISFEKNYYRNNPLANGNTITVSYLFPYKLVKEARKKAGL